MKSTSSVHWTIDKHDRNIRRGYDVITGRHIATTTKVNGSYSMHVMDSTSTNHDPVFVGTRSTLQDAQWLLSTIAEVYRVMSVEHMRRGEMASIEKLALLVDLIERKILEQVAADEM